MKTSRILASLALAGSLAVGAQAADTETQWWSVDFDTLDLTQRTETGDLAANGGTFNFVVDSDTSTIETKDGNTTPVLYLNTQGENITFTPAANDAEYNRVLVDADVYFVGSETAPAPTTFDGDSANPVQTAVFLKNNLDDNTGDIVDSVLCVYADNDDGVAAWQELTSTKGAIADGSWQKLRIVVNYSSAVLGTVTVYINDVAATNADGESAFVIANNTALENKHKLNSVAFRGTGAIDNFVGASVTHVAELTKYAVQYYLNGAATTATSKEVEADKDAQFDVLFDNYDAETEAAATQWLTKVELLAADGSVTDTINFTYDAEDANFQFLYLAEDSAAYADKVYINGNTSTLTLNIKPWAAEGEATEAGYVLIKAYWTDGNETPVPPVEDPTEVVIGGADTQVEGVPPVQITAEGFTVTFKAPQAGITYTLVSSNDCTSDVTTWAEVEGTAKVSTEAGETITLTAPMSNTVEFFVIKASNAAE